MHPGNLGARGFAGQMVPLNQVDERSGSPPLCTTIWDTSTMRYAHWSVAFRLETH